MQVKPTKLGKEVKIKMLITEHPELRWWWNAITVRAAAMNAFRRKS